VVVDEDVFDNSVEVWQTLVHVCRRWRSVVFGSPRRLNLRLFYTEKTPARDTLDIWPSLPLLIRSDHITNVDNIIAVLKCNQRVVKIKLFANNSDLENVLAAAMQPFTALTHLELGTFRSRDGTAILPDSFLGGSAPRLQKLRLRGILFPGLPKLLLSATHLVRIDLWDIPHSGYFSSEAMVTALSASISLENLWLQFESPRSRPDPASRRPPPLTFSVLPALTTFHFKGVTEYLDDIVAHINAPRLNKLDVTFFNQIVFDTPQLIQFISRTPTLETLEKALVVFEFGTACVNLSSKTSGYGKLNVAISCVEFDWQVSSMEQVCTLCLPPLSTLEDVYIYERSYSQESQPIWQDIENTLWLELLQPFTTVKNLYLSKEFALRIVPALQELIGGRTTEVLPSLQNIFLEEPQPPKIRYGIQQFVTTRQVTSHRIAVSQWDRDRSRPEY
jgi:hypothetical protein